MDPYKILGLQPGATQHEIRQAYRKQAAKYHPDTGGDAWVFQQVQEAYAVLTGKAKPKARRSSAGQAGREPTEPNSSRSTHQEGSGFNRGFDSSQQSQHAPNPDPGSARQHTNHYGSSGTGRRKPKPKPNEKRAHADQSKILTPVAIAAVAVLLIFVALVWGLISAGWSRTGVRDHAGLSVQPIEDTNANTYAGEPVADSPDPDPQATQLASGDAKIESELQVPKGASADVALQAKASQAPSPDASRDTAPELAVAVESTKSMPEVNSVGSVETSRVDLVPSKLPLEPIKILKPDISRAGNATNKVRQIEFPTNSDFIFSTSQTRQKVLLWEPTQLNLTNEIDVGQHVECIAINNKANRIAVGTIADKKSTQEGHSYRCLLAGRQGGRLRWL